METDSAQVLPSDFEQQIESQLKALKGMTRRQLQRRWLELLPTSAHPRLSRALLVSILSYRIQEEVCGGLLAEQSKRLRRLGEKGSDGSPKRRGNVKAGPEISGVQCARKKKPATRVQLRPGTRLLRQWRGQTYAVTVAERGYEYSNRLYKSLSEIAGVITGSRWSGPLFFGLKEPSGKAAAKDLGAEES